jgi:hypothetical protein
LLLLLLLLQLLYVHTLKDENASEAISKLATSTRWKNSIKSSPYSSMLQPNLRQSLKVHKQ